MQSLILEEMEINQETYGSTKREIIYPLVTDPLYLACMAKILI